MFMQIHVIQSLPPGNVNRDDTGQPKKCIFGGVTRARISSQCLKRYIRRSPQFSNAFGSDLANRTQYLPKMVADALNKGDHGVPEGDLNDVMLALAKRFKKNERERAAADAADEGEEQQGGGAPSGASDGVEKTPQLVFFQQPFAADIAKLIADFKSSNPEAYHRFLGRKPTTKLPKEERKRVDAAMDAAIDALIQQAAEASKKLTIDIGLFGRMTTSDLVVNVEAACQVAHAIGTHETIIESDYFTAMDECKANYSTSQSESAGAAFLGSGETETFFNSSVYYKYFNIDFDGLQRNLPNLSDADLAQVASVFIEAASLSHPGGKQNSLANPVAPEIVLVEISTTKQPMSYANAFVEPVEGANLVKHSAEIMCEYVGSISAAYAPPDTDRVLLAVGHAASVNLSAPHTRVSTLLELCSTVAMKLQETRVAGVST